MQVAELIRYKLFKVGLYMRLYRQTWLEQMTTIDLLLRKERDLFTMQIYNYS